MTHFLGANGPKSRGFARQPRAEALDNLRRDRAQTHRAKPRQDMPVPKTRVAAERSRREIRRRVELPPLLGEVGKRFPPAREQVQIAGALAPHDLGLECVRVPLATDNLGARPTLLVAPTHPPDSATLPLDPFDAHGQPLLAFRRLIEQHSQAALRDPSATSRSCRHRWIRPTCFLGDPTLQLRRMHPEPVTEPRRTQLAPRNRPIDGSPRQAAGPSNVLRGQQALKVVVSLVGHFLCTDCPPRAPNASGRPQIRTPQPGVHTGGRRTAKPCHNRPPGRPGKGPSSAARTRTPVWVSTMCARVSREILKIRLRKRDSRLTGRAEGCPNAPAHEPL